MERKGRKKDVLNFESPLRSCLISLLACEVVNWFTMSRAV